MARSSRMARSSGLVAAMALLVTAAWGSPFRIDSQGLLMTVRAGGFNGAGSSCRLVKGSEPRYPGTALKRRLQGNLFAAFTVMPDGRARSPRFIYAVPDHLFEDAARDSLRESVFEAPVVDGKRVPCRGTMFFGFQFDEVHAPRTDGMFADFQKAREAAKAGNPGAQLIYGMMLAGVPELRGDPVEAMAAFKAAARAGVAVAQFLYGTNLLGGWIDERDEASALEWLRKAADQDQPDALVTLSGFALRDDGEGAGAAQAREMLERAVARGHGDAKLHLAALLAAAPRASLRDPARALVLLKEVAWDHPKEPEIDEIHAAAFAGLDRFDEAVKRQQAAVDLARRLEWDTAPLEEKLAAYKGNEPWFGNLLAHR